MKTRHKIFIITAILILGGISIGLNLEPVKAATRKIVYNLRSNDGLVGYWSFNGADMSGATAIDRGSGGNNGDLIGGPIVTPGVSGQALIFDGANDYMHVPSNMANIRMTVEGWINPSTVADGHFIASEGVANSGLRFYIKFSSGKLQWSCYDGAYYTVNSDSVISTNAWTHFAAVLDGGVSGGMKIFIDGIQQSETQTIANCGAYGTFYLGSYLWPIGSYFAGLMDEIRVYNRALGATEIAYQYNRTKPAGSGTVAKSVPNNNGLVGYWDFDDCDTCTTVADRSGNGKTGTMYASDGVVGDLHTVSGKVGRAASLDGSDDYISIGDISSYFSNQEATFTAWVKRNSHTAPTEAKGGSWFFNTGQGANSHYVWTDGNIYDGSFKTVRTSVGAGIISDRTQWHFISITRKAGADGWKFYQNAQEISSADGGTWDIGTSVKIGESNSDLYNFDGLIDEVRIYNRALSATEVKNLYNSTRTMFVGVSSKNIVDDGLVSYMSFNGPDMYSTTAYDRSGNGNNGTLTGGPTTVPGMVGQALNFDGVNDYVDTPAQAFLGLSDATFTVSAWVRPDVIGGTIFHNRNDSTGWSTGLLGYIGGKLDGFIYSGTGHIVSSTSAVAGRWYHVALTRDASGNAKLYENGVQVGSGSGTYSPSGSAQKFTVGRYVGDCCVMDPPGWFDGLIDEARLYNRALSAGEILKLYNAGKP